MPEPSDEALMREVRSGDRDAFGLLLDRHLPGIQAYAFRMTDNRADAEDIAQEAFLRVWHRANTYRPGRVQVSTWLYRIAHNLCIDAFRKHRETVDGALETLAGETPDGAATAMAEERRRAVRKAVAALPERQRSALVLCQLQGWSNRDAALAMEVSVDALESLLARARRALKEQLRGFHEADGEG